MCERVLYDGCLVNEWSRPGWEAQGVSYGCMRVLAEYSKAGACPLNMCGVLGGGWAVGSCAGGAERLCQYMTGTSTRIISETHPASASSLDCE